MHDFILVFVPLFVAIDAIGNLPFVISISQGMSPIEKRRVINLATITAAIVGLAFLLLGRLVLDAMGISVGAFAIAGGIVLLAFSLRDMMTGRFAEVTREEMVAVVPIGTPLTVGPATITTLLLMSNEHPLYLVLTAFLLNIVIVWISFLLSERISGFLGLGGVTAVSRVFGLLLAAIAVSMIIKGLDLLEIVHVAT